VTKPFYSFDTSAFIKGRRDLLPPTVFPSLWANVEKMIIAGIVRATDEVRRELGRRDDDTNAWAMSQDGLFVDLDEDIQVATISILAAHPKLTGSGGGRHQADPFVIGLAHARNGVVVTEETMSNNLNKPRIPDVCRAMGIRCINLVQFAQDQCWRF
jgi:Domain of unknown function (DUF4411)